MSTNIRVESNLNKIVNIVTGQGKIRQKRLKCYPMCLLHGNFSKTLIQMITMELASKIGEESFGMMHINHAEEAEEQAEDTLECFRRKMDEGRLERLPKIYIPVIFMADQVNAEELKNVLSEFIARMRQKGYVLSGTGGSVNYEIWYYCVFNYSSMNGKECKTQITGLWKSWDLHFPMCIYTQDYQADAEDQKYLKAVQSMAMHIFLKALGEKEAAFAPSDKEMDSRLFVTGYWKMDVLKQKTADYLKKVIERQGKAQIKQGQYIDQIRGKIDRAADFTEDWPERFCRMPVNYTDISRLLHTGPFQRRPRRTYGEILKMLYGRKDAFRLFMAQNCGNTLNEKTAEQFFSSGLGNLYEVENWLEHALKTAKNKYAAQKSELLAKMKSMEDEFVFEKNSTAAQLLSELKEAFWEQEVKIINLEYKSDFTECLLKYLRSDTFQEVLLELKNRNEEDKRYLGLVRREVFLGEDRISSILDLQFPISEDAERQSWKDDIFAEDSVARIARSLSKEKRKIQGWMTGHADHVLKDFVARLQELKRTRYMDQYYSARINIPQNCAGQEYFYISPGVQQQNSIALEQKYQNIAKLKLPEAVVLAKEWEADMCFELFAVKEAGSLDEIYNMNVS